MSSTDLYFLIGADRDPVKARLKTYAVDPAAFRAKLEAGERITKDDRRSTMEKGAGLAPIHIDRDHLEGLALPMYGRTPFVSSTAVAWGVLDDDRYDPEDPDKTAREMAAWIEANNVPAVAEKTFSGGAHAWFFFEKATPAAQAIRFLEHYYRLFFGPDAAPPNTEDGHELFPKQARLEDNARGSMVHLPYAGRQPLCYGVTADGRRLSLEEWTSLAKSRRIDAAAVEAIAGPHIEEVETTPTQIRSREDQRQHTPAATLDEVREMLLGAWPGEASQKRHKALLALMRTLYEAGFAEEDAIAFALEIVQKTGDDVQERRNEIKNQYAAFEGNKRNDRYTGLARLIQLLGLDDEKAQALREWRRKQRRAFIFQGALLVGGGCRHETVVECERRLHESGEYYAVASGHIARFKDGSLVPVENPQMLAGIMDTLGTWYKSDSGKPSNADYEQQLFYRSERDHLRTVRRLIKSPTILADGTILQQDGYYPDSQLLVVIGDENRVEVPDDPDEAQVRAAIKRMLAPISEYKFFHESGPSVFLSGQLCALGTPAIGRTPAHFYGGTGPGAGKGNITFMHGRQIEPDGAATHSWTYDSAEDGKMLTSVLIGGGGYLNFDNLDAGLPEHAMLMRILTEDRQQLRILGGNKLASVEHGIFVYGNLNGFTHSLAALKQPDILRRSVWAVIDAPPDPENHQYPFEPRAFYMENRRQHIADTLTVLRFFFKNEKAFEGVEVPAHGSFERYRDLIRKPLVALGFADPLGAVIADKAGGATVDPYKTGVLQAWLETFGTKAVTSREVWGQKAGDFGEALDAYARSKGKQVEDVASLGMLLLTLDMQYLGRDFRFRKSSQQGHLNVALWQMTVVEDKVGANVEAYKELARYNVS